MFERERDVVQAVQQVALRGRVVRELEERWARHRVVVGPWRWMLLVYRIDADNDRVVVVTVQDARTSAAATGRR